LPLDGSDASLLKSALVCPCDDALIGDPMRLLTHLRVTKLADSCVHSMKSSSWLPSQRNLNFAMPSSGNNFRGDGKKSIDECILDDWAVRTGLSGQCCGIKASFHTHSFWNIFGCLGIVTYAPGIPCFGRLSCFIRSDKKQQMV
jgi:hypothetical protein